MRLAGWLFTRTRTSARYSTGLMDARDRPSVAGHGIREGRPGWTGSSGAPCRECSGLTRNRRVRTLQVSVPRRRRRAACDTVSGTCASAACTGLHHARCSPAAS